MRLNGHLEKGKKTYSSFNGELWASCLNALKHSIVNLLDFLPLFFANSLIIYASFKARFCIIRAFIYESRASLILKFQAKLLFIIQYPSLICPLSPEAERGSYNIMKARYCNNYSKWEIKWTNFFIIFLYKEGINYTDTLLSFSLTLPL